MDAIKAALTTRSIAYFNKNWRSEVTVDASPVGLGLVFAQYDPENPSKRHIVRYDSRTLSDVESRYSQVEKEALAVVWACEKLHLYLFGPYSFVVKHRPGDGNIADYLSRNPINQDDMFNKFIHEEIAERYVRSISRNCLPSALRISDIVRETEEDLVLFFLFICENDV